MDIGVTLTIAFFVILISIQYTLNKILSEIKDIKRVLEKNREVEYKPNSAKQNIH